MIWVVLGAAWCATAWVVALVVARIVRQRDRQIPHDGEE